MAPPLRRNSRRATRVVKAPATRARLDVDKRRTQLLALGLTLFSERSYDEISVDDLARAAGVSKGLLYHYFPTKRDFYVAALRATAQQLLDETHAADGAVTPEEQVRRGLETYLSFVDRRRVAYVALVRGGIGSDPEVAAVIEETRAVYLARILERLPSGRASAPLLRTALRGWIGFVEATAIEWVARRAVPIEQLVTLALSVLFDAVRVAALASPSGTRRDGKAVSAPRHRDTHDRSG